ncbi:MAG TPA: hypothetical protein VJ718_02750 [Candidatus Binataceae bacterium]|nr:hypothetical protein [Candidatus Binataceae bacterium]
MQGGFDSILLPEIITPSQYRDSRSKTRWDDPVGRLMLAVLTDAVVSYQKNARSGSRKGARLFAELQEWFFESGADDPFSCESICDTLHIDLNALRAGLRTWSEKGGEPIERISRRSLVRHNGKITARARRRVPSAHSRRRAAESLERSDNHPAAPNLPVNSQVL